MPWNAFGVHRLVINKRSTLTKYKSPINRIPSCSTLSALGKYYTVSTMPFSLSNFISTRAPTPFLLFENDYLF